MRRRCADIAFGLYCWFLVLVLGPPLYLAVLSARTPARRWARLRFAGTLLVKLTRLRIEIGAGIEAAPPVVYVANHNSFLDAMSLIVALSERVVFVAGAGLSRQLIAGPFLKAIGATFVGSGTSRGLGALAEPERALLSGASVVIFPEGGLSKTASLRRFHLGAFVLGLNTDVPIVPVALSGTRAMLAPGTRLVRKHDVVVDLGAPLSSHRGAKHEARLLAEDARGAIEVMLAQRNQPSG